MGDLLQTGATFLQQQRHAHMAHAVTYVRSGTPIVPDLNATIGKSTFEQRDADRDFGVDIDTRDFTFFASDLKTNGTQFEPGENDRIIETIAGVARTYAPVKGAGDKYFRYEDMGRTSIRIHTVMLQEGGS